MARSLPAASRVSPPLVAASLSVLLHVGLIVIVLVNGGTHDGDDAGHAPLTHLFMLTAAEVDPRKTVETQLVIPTLAFEKSQPNEPALDTPPTVTIERVNPEISPAAPELEQAASETPVETEPGVVTANLSLPDEEKAALAEALVRTAEELASSGSSQITWQADDQRYSAVLVLERAREGTALDRVHAEVRADHYGKPLIARLELKRLAFSSYSQVVDRWDPNVQMHDDAIDGRVHINSRFNLMYDRRTAPQLLGKVSTAARGFNVQSSGSRRERDIFRGGIETRAGRIIFPEQVQPFAWAPRDDNALVHECANDTRILFFPDGSYSWLDIDSRTSQYAPAATDRPVYFIASRGATVYVKGVVSGSVLVYSPERIVIEGNLTYAHDPRRDSTSRDYLGLVSDGTVVVAPPRVTGHDDLDIHAAILARRRFVVTDIEYTRAATLRIFGSLSAGTLSATEPRYATQLEYDRRLETHRPPGFPSTNRFVVDGWSDTWASDGTDREW